MSDGPLRVMQVVSNLEIGGAQEVVRTLAQHLAEAGCAPVVCAFKDGPLRREIERLGVPVEILPDRRHSVVALPLFALDMLRIRRALAGLVRRYRVEVVQTHLLMSLDFLVLTLRGRAGPRVFWTVQNANFTLRSEHLPGHRWLLGPKRLAFRLLYRAALPWLDGFIAVSDEVRRAIVREVGAVPEHKLAVICNSVDVGRFRRGGEREATRRALGLPAGAPVAAVVATFKRQKGHRFMIEAAALAVARRPDLRILFVGDGELRESLRAQARRAGLEGHILFLGSRHDVPDLLAASDLFVLPSLWEGLSMALVEAMAAGLPVIATAVSGTTQVMVDGETGLLVPPDDPAALAAALRRLVDDPAARWRMGEQAAALVRRDHDVRRNARRLIQVLKWAADAAYQPGRAA